MWTRDKAYKAGQIDDPRCTLCGEEDEEILHCWTCKAFENQKRELDKDLAEVDPKHIPNVVKVGIAPAMMMDPTKPLWGNEDENEDNMDEKTKKLFGCREMQKLKCRS